MLLVMKFLLTRCIRVGFLERRKGKRKGGGGETSTPLRNLRHEKQNP